MTGVQTCALPILFNLKGVEKIREVQKQAVEDSRLGIPLLFGMDVIHGYETMFPIPVSYTHLDVYKRQEVIKELSQRGLIAVDSQGYLREVRDTHVYPVDWTDKRLSLIHI